jgi:hypothetical protein
MPHWADRVLVLALVGGAAWFIAHRAWQRLASMRATKAAGSCGHDNCGCKPPA